MITAEYQGIAVASSSDTVYLEGNHYFPLDSVQVGILEKSWLRTFCFWKGIARYYHVTLDGERLPNSAWSYPAPSPLARRIRGMIAFEAHAGIIIQDHAD